MTREELLFKALEWALDKGVSAYSINGEVTMMDSGCGCCSDTIEPPEEIAAVVLEAIKKL